MKPKPSPLRVVDAPTASARIRAAREEAGWRQLDLAQSAGLSLVTVSGAERGLLTPRTAERLAAALHLDPRSVTPGAADPASLITCT